MVPEAYGCKRTFYELTLLDVSAMGQLADEQCRGPVTPARCPTGQWVEATSQGKGSEVKRCIFQNTKLEISRIIISKR